MVVFGDENIVLLKEVLSPYCDYFSFSGRKLKKEDLINNQCDILFTRSQTKINRSLLEGTDIKLIATATSGTDHFDLEYLKEANIPFFDARGSNANSVAEYVFYSILKWSYNIGRDINTLTIGIVGFGCVGKIVYSYAKELGMNILVNDPPLFESGYVFPDDIQYSELNELIANSQILTNHVPLTFSGNNPTYNLFNSENLNTFGNDGLIIHTSRGNVAEENALLKLNQKNNVTLVVDVWANEPEFNNKLAENCMISTPHIAGYSHNGKLNGTMMILDIFDKYSGTKTDKSLIIKEYNKVPTFIINHFKNTETVYDELIKRRQIEDDSQCLKNLINHQKNIQNEEFDLLRKNYPVRYELLNPVF